MRRIRAFHVLAVSIALGCGRSEIVSGVSDSAFVATMAELRQVEQPGMDSSAAIRARQGVLQRRGLTADQLEQAARALAGDPERAAKVWDAIAQRVSGVTEPNGVKPPNGAGRATVPPSGRLRR